MDILLIAGLWLDGSVWDNVTVELEARGHRGIPVTLPGQGDGNTSATLADQSAAVVAAVDAAAGRPMVAGHSAACNLAWLAADARPGKLSKVALIGGFPSSDGLSGQGIARAALEGALDQIAHLGGGRVEAISEVTAGREAQGRFLFSATVELFEQNGFTRVRQVGKHAWIVSKVVQAT